MDSIRNWYLNAEGGSGNLPGYDWENDDQLDRNPDSWLDRLAHHDIAPNGDRVAPKKANPRKPESPKSRQSSESVKRGKSKQKRVSKGARGGGRGAATSADRSLRRNLQERPISFERFAEIVQKLHFDQPALGFKRLTRELRQRGWSGVREVHVRLIIEMHQANTAAPLGKPSGSSAVRPVRMKEDRQGVGDRRPVEEKKRSRKASTRRRSSGELPASYRKRPPSVIEDPSAFCPACGVRVTSLGICRCS